MGKSACVAWIVLGLGWLLALGVRVESAAPEVPIVNLYRGEINGTRFSALTADRIRSLFGAPAAIEGPENPQENQETYLHYHAFGLSFGMYQPGAQSPLQCWRVRMYLSHTWDAKAGMFFLPFPGRVSKQVQQDWTPERIVKEFQQWYPHSPSPEQASGLVQGSQRGQAPHDAYQVLALDMGDFQVDFFYAPAAQRLHALMLTVLRPVTPAAR